MKKSVFLPVLVILFLANLALLSPQTLGLYGDTLGRLNLLVDVRHQLMQGYVEQPDNEKMIESAVRGMIGSLQDPYTAYLTPDELRTFDRETGGSFSGIGAEVTIDPVVRRLKIVTPLEDSPAWNAGVLAGDIVLEIDGEDTEDMPLNVAVDKLIGKEGTQVTIKVRHESGEEQTIPITRGRIVIQTVRGFRRDAEHHWDFMLSEKHKIGYVRLTQFSGPTADDLRAAVTELVEDGVKAIILDLRFNGGGLLPSAVEVSDMFLPAGKTVVSVRGRAVPEETYTSTSDQIAEGVDLIVLANEYSASASEIVTGALHDNDRAKFIGTRTFGKGSVQQVKALGNLGALKMTNAYYYIPSGRKIHKTPDKEDWGVDPDDGFFVTMTFDEMKAMQEARREGDILRHDAGEGADGTITADWLRKTAADPQLAAAVDAIVQKQEQGEWVAIGESGADVIAKAQTHANLVKQRELLTERLQQVNEELAKLDADENAQVEVEVEEGAIQTMPDNE